MAEVKLSHYDQMNQNFEFIYYNGTEMNVFDSTEKALEDLMSYLDKKKQGDFELPAYMWEAVKVIHKNGGMKWIRQEQSRITQL